MLKKPSFVRLLWPRATYWHVAASCLLSAEDSTLEWIGLVEDGVSRYFDVAAIQECDGYPAVVIERVRIGDEGRLVQRWN